MRLTATLETLRPGIRAADLVAAQALVAYPTTGLRSPWQASPNPLVHIAFADVFGTQTPTPLTRAEAIRVPAVSRARGILTGTIARIPLHAYRGARKLTGDQAPAWLTATDGALHPMHRMLWTVDDLYFYGFSLWRRTVNAAPSDGGFPLRMERVAIGEWSIEEGTRRILIYKPDGRGSVGLLPARTDEVVLIPGPHGGMLEDGVDSVRHAAELQRAAHKAAKHPAAHIVLKQTGGTPLKRRSDDVTEVTVETVVADWVKARNGENAGVAFTGLNVTAEELGTFDAHLVVEGRNAAAVDIARHSQLPADLIDASIPQSSLHYSTSRDNDRRAVDYGLGFYMSSISAALSMDTVTPRGQHLGFDLEEWLKGDASGAAPGQPAQTTPPGMSRGAVPTTGEPPL